MTTLNTTGQSVLDILSAIAWATGRTIHYSTSAYQGARRFYGNEIASGALRRDLFAAANAMQDGIDDALEAGDRFLNHWQAFSDDLRALIWIVLGPLLALLWGAAYDVAMGCARLLGRVWGYWMGQAVCDMPLALVAARRWVAAKVRSLVLKFWADVRAWGQQAVVVCDRALEAAFCLS